MAVNSKKTASKKTVEIRDDALAELINSYTSEAGVHLERLLSASAAVATQIAEKKRRKAVIAVKDLPAILGPRKYESELAMRTATPGVVTGLAYTPVGGEILFVESVMMPGKGLLVLTGQIGEVMKESAQAAFSVVSQRQDAGYQARHLRQA